ncbi:hypothetical protein [Mycobacteroides abscessus]|uniref:hypothetical protein n=1 Tax=Mycobacteroides abscessus TaxID=36809 RepID=UPI00092B136B|nr:hypothetical protein [Mycobacteroides abscessus]SIK83467.1 Uncharacterised protein [Mycobacteroides abscessus subsp. abscessus]SIM02511.1 Uncharacterised protein [Mycobacteroides abscessus subsp. abscessus]SIM39455.1 Uncharacterised protein [Mycobacteroides abscessus subsp. abscessus]
MDTLGGQRLAIVWDVPVLDGQGDPILDEYRKPQVTERVAWVDNCLFEVQSTAEDNQAITTTTTEQSWAFLPVVDGHIPAVDGSGAAAPVAVADIGSAHRIRHLGRDHSMVGDAVLEFDLDGREDHVFCICQRRVG